MNKRLVSLLLSLVIVLGILPFNLVSATETPVKTTSLYVTDTAKKYNSLSFDKAGFEEFVVDSILSQRDEINLERYGDYFSFRYDGESLSGKTENEKYALITECIHRKYPELDFQRYADKYVDLYNLRQWGYGMVYPVNDPTDITIVSITPWYYFSKDSYETRNTAYKAVAESMVADLKTAPLTDIEKALILHDRLAVHCEYDQENYDKWLTNPQYDIPPDSFNMYGALVNRVAVCQGYSKAYKYMLDLLGIPNRICVSDKASHMWNIVTIDGKDYHIDVTHDDPVRDLDGRVHHTYFLVSTNKFKALNINSDDFDTTPNDITYDSYFWGNSGTAFRYVNGDIYYVDNQSSDLMVWNGDAPKQIVDIRRSADSNIKLCSYGNILYYLYNNKVYEVDTTQPTLNPHIVWTPDLPEGYNAYGLEVVGNRLTVQCFIDPNYGEEYLLKHTIEKEIDITDALEAALLNGVKCVTYDGTPKTFNFGVAYNGELLRSDEDFAAVYSSNINAGKATVTLSGQNGYIGTASATFTILSRSINNVTIFSIPDKEYTGSAIKPTPSVSLDGKRLKVGTDYLIGYSSNVNTGKATVKITGNGNYVGTASKNFYIHPKAVQGVKFQSSTAKSIKIKWNQVKNGTGYAVRRKTSKNGEFKTIAIINSLKTTTYTDKKVKANKTYYYDVVAFKTVDGKKYGSTASKLIIAKTATSAPKINYNKNTSSKKAKIKWKKVSGATGYKLYVSTKKGSGYKCIYTGSKREFTKAKLKKGKTYYFKVRTYKKFGGKKLYSSYSAVKSIKIRK